MTIVNPNEIAANITLKAVDGVKVETLFWANVGGIWWIAYHCAMLSDKAKCIALWEMPKVVQRMKIPPADCPTPLACIIANYWHYTTQRRNETNIKVKLGHTLFDDNACFPGLQVLLIDGA